MANLTIPEDIFRRLAARANALNMTVDDLVTPVLDRLADSGDPQAESQSPLTGAAWQAELEAWKRDAESRANRYGPGFSLDDSRESMYREREDAQL